ncbi:MAG: archease [Desulfomonilia bacterium]
MPYVYIDHTADIGVRISASNIRELFRDAGYALVDVMKAASDDDREQVEITSEGIDRIDLLVRWLQEILYVIEVKDFRVSRIVITSLGETDLTASLTGMFSKTQLAREIKAVTYHNLDIRDVDNHLEATIILDT